MTPRYRIPAAYSPAGTAVSVVDDDNRYNAGTDPRISLMTVSLPLTEVYVKRLPPFPRRAALAFTKRGEQFTAHTVPGLLRRSGTSSASRIQGFGGIDAAATPASASILIHVAVADQPITAIVQRLRRHLDGREHLAGCSGHPSVGQQRNLESTILQVRRDTASACAAQAYRSRVVPAPAAQRRSPVRVRPR